MNTSSTTTARLRYDRTLGLASMEGRGFSSPVDLANSSDGRIYVASRSNPTQTYGIRVGVCNLDSDYRLYVTESIRHRIQVYTIER